MVYQNQRLGAAKARGAVSFGVNVIRHSVDLELGAVTHWAFVSAAYLLTAAVLLGYWWRVERRIRAIETRAPDPPQS